MNKLYFGDNLEIMRRHIADDSVDLVYLDPPFNSDARYNVLFKSTDGSAAQSQATAFRDSWSWQQQTQREFEKVATEIGGSTAEIITALHRALGPSDTMAYLVMMAVRLFEIRRVLRPGGAMFLHCDPTASHYLKVILDGIFRPDEFRNEISWRRSSAHSDAKQGSTRFGNVRDVILFYSKQGAAPTWNTQFTPYLEDYLSGAYKHIDADGRRYRMGDLTAAKTGGDTRYQWRIKKPKRGQWTHDLTDEYLNPMADTEYSYKLPYGARIWAYSRANMVAMAEQGRIVYAATGMPNYKRFLDEMPGVALQNDWPDLKPIAASAAEREGYPTQKPVALLERIIRCVTDPGQTVLDPFCGCGTTIHAAQTLGRSWIGIDVATHATSVIQRRLKRHFGVLAGTDYKFEGMPKDFDGARELAIQDPYQFQWWANYMLGVQQVGDTVQKGRDRGIDGKLFFLQGPGKGPGKLIVSVKSGKCSVNDLRALAHVVKRETAEGGIFVTLEPATKEMSREAVSEGAFRSAGGLYPKLQIISMREWFEAGLRPAIPVPMRVEEEAPTGRSKSTKRRLVDPRQPEFFFDLPGGKETTINPATIITPWEIEGLKAGARVRAVGQKRGL